MNYAYDDKRKNLFLCIWALSQLFYVTATFLFQAVMDKCIERSSYLDTDQNFSVSWNIIVRLGLR